MQRSGFSGKSVQFLQGINLSIVNLDIKQRVSPISTTLLSLDREMNGVLMHAKPSVLTPF